MTQPYRNPSDIYPSLTYEDAPAAIDWLCRAFGFAKRFVVAGPDDRIEHSELSLGTGVVMISSPKAEDRRASPKALAGVAQALSVYVADPDTHHAVSIAAGARIVRPLRTEEYGARGYMALDPEDHLWYFGNYRPGEYWQAQEGVPSEAERADAMAATGPLARWHRIVAHHDVAGLADLLADEVVFHSPVVHAPQRGKAITTRYLGAALRVFGNASFRYVREVSGERDAVLEFEVEIDGIHVNGVDMIRWDDTGRVVDFKVMLRPLKAVDLIHQQMAAMLQER